MSSPAPTTGRIVAVIPTYRPPERLAQLVRNVRAQVDDVVVYDDASPAADLSALDVVETLGFAVERGAMNAGIARGLNVGLARAAGVGATWLLTVDQDSDLPDGLVARLAKTAANAAQAGIRVGAVGVEVIADASGDMRFPVDVEGGVVTTAEVIQTGTLWSVAALQEVGGFDESFGIDAVDAAACLRLRERGYRIVVAPGTSIGHELGSNARQVQLLGRTVVATGHSPARRETMVRNRLRLAPAEFRQSPMQAFRSLRRLLVNTALAVTVEDARWEKAKASARGLLPKR